MANVPPRRRWFQFGLRTMFVVVTVVAVFIGYHVNWVRERHLLISRANTDSYWVMDFTVIQVPVPSPVRAPAVLALFGERGYSCLTVVFNPSSAGFADKRNLTPEEESTVAYVARVFSEARIISLAFEVEVVGD